MCLLSCELRSGPIIRLCRREYTVQAYGIIDLVLKAGLSEEADAYKRLSDICIAAPDLINRM